MLQEASTHLILPESSEDLIASEPWTIDTYADGLMDELFADIDHVLDGKKNLPPEYVRMQTVTVPQIVLPERQMRQVQTVPQARNKQLSTVVVNTNAEKAVSKPRLKSRRSLGKLLSVGATISLAVAGMIYLLNSGLLNLLTTKLTQQALETPQAQPQLLPVADAESELVDYMLGALAVIDRQEAKNNQKPANTALNASAVGANQMALANVSNLPSGNLPSPLAANNTVPPPVRSTVVERIYIPVYQAPPPMRYAPPPIPGAANRLPAIASMPKGSKPPSVRNALNNPPKAAKPVTMNMLAAAVRTELKPVTVRTAPITLRQPSKPLPTLPVVPFQAAPPKLPAAKAPVKQQQQAASTPPPVQQQAAYFPASPIASAPTHSLKGLLELGNKSAALFEIEGVTQRIDIGESIGSTGWTLVEISNKEAVIRRNGEVRSIYTGQNF